MGGGAAVAGSGAGTTAKAGAGGGAFPQALSTPQAPAPTRCTDRTFAVAARPANHRQVDPSSFRRRLLPPVPGQHCPTHRRQDHTQAGQLGFNW